MSTVVRDTQGNAQAYQRVEISDGQFARLLWWNRVAAVLHAVQAMVMLALSTSVALPVTALYATGRPGSPPDPQSLDVIGTLRLGPAVAAFLALSAVFHLAVSFGPGARWYRTELAAHRNRLRWVEYSLSASWMIVLIAMITGISDLAALIALFGVNAAMIWFGWLTETTNARGGPLTWTPFFMGCLAGIVPWLAIGVYLAGAGSGMPGFVYGIYVSLFAFFNGFAVNQWLQYRRRGRWADYLTGERAYLVLSLSAKSLLAWQVFANVLV